MSMVPSPSIQKNDKKAKWFISIVSVVIFVVIASLSKLPPPKFPFDFNVHIFAFINAVINSAVSVLLVWGLVSAKQKKFTVHKNVMLFAIILSVLFLVFYIGHHLFAGDTKYGDINHDGLLDAAETAAVSGTRYIYYFILVTHIILAAVILPFILFTAYRALTGEYSKHKKIARYTWPLWFYIAVTGVVVYWMISPYYS
jgi:putative membrane protein